MKAEKQVSGHIWKGMTFGEQTLKTLPGLVTGEEGEEAGTAPHLSTVRGKSKHTGCSLPRQNQFTPTPTPNQDAGPAREVGQALSPVSPLSPILPCYWTEERGTRDGSQAINSLCNLGTVPVP